MYVILVIFLLLWIWYLPLSVQIRLRGTHQELSVECKLYVYIKQLGITKKWENILLTPEGLKATSKTKHKQEKSRFTLRDVLVDLEIWKKIQANISGLHRLVKACLGGIHIKKFSFVSHLALKEAHHTALVTQGVHTFVYLLLAIMSTYMRLDRKPHVVVIPHFSKGRGATVRFDCIGRIKVGHTIRILVAGIRYGLIRTWRSIREELKHERASDSRVNENSNGKH
ncbi:DUF2953 domain-containing protein [Paenalkalicoccus suaedae]|uniref:DUF2953 domain-containing protein n=1 Tax=Paenalkalicoccus suaedae TaxID=2592382 RepID=A0A859FFZ6_9BACI|nr:DUF2953 domain-containing protein [Paenalkalicoccus suaedae]QKS72059.1 DUF2953 domain-containing protein [Paenalkalicoccus suaedae]